MNTLPVIVSTDLDGTLLDHYSYSWADAKPSIDALMQRGIPIVINTSKTFAEVEQLQKELALNAPFVVENGSAIYYPKGQYQSDAIFPYNALFDYQVVGQPRSEILSALKHLTEEFQYIFEGYNDWSTENIIERTGLTPEGARLSQQREYSEPIIWGDSEERFETFSQQIKSKELRLIRGGRFIHILGQADKGTALKALTRSLFGEIPAKLICLGDGPNDLDMLAIADFPVFIRSPAHDFPEFDTANNTYRPNDAEAYYTEGHGPAGWHEAMQKILIKLDNNFGDTHG